MTPAWLAALPEALGSLRGIASPTLTIDGTSTAIGGGIASEDARARITAALGSLGLPIEDSLQIAEAPGAAEAGGLESILNDAVADSSILFETGSTEISAEGRVVLDRLALAVASVPGARIEVAGHTDDVGDPDANLALSQARAEAVVSYLIGAGADPIQLRAVGYGETQPIADNSTDEGRAANRRIEFAVEGAE